MNIAATIHYANGHKRTVIGTLHAIKHRAQASNATSITSGPRAWRYERGGNPAWRLIRC